MDHRGVETGRFPEQQANTSTRARRAIAAAIEQLECRRLLAASFASAANYSVGSGADFIDSGDFNSDGKRDLVISSYAGSRLSILFGNGSGGFAAASHINMDVPPDFVIAGDVNGDGKADLITASYDNDTIGVRLGIGDGTFAAGIDYAAGAGPRSVVLADFTGDGEVDIVVAKSFTKQLTILRNNGNGTFQAPLNASLSITPVDFVAGDFNADGKMDLAAADFFTDKIAVMLGNGNATFQTATTYTTAAGPSSIAAGDLNGDGVIDLATANFFGNNLSIFRGNSNGTFGTATNVAAGTGATYVAAGDLDGNGSIDLAVANANADTVSLIFNLGSGSFQSAVSYAVGESPRSLLISNFNGGGVDVAVANQGSANVSVLIGNGAVTGPSADAGGPYNVNEGGTVQLSALGSTGSDLTYAWDLDGDSIFGEVGTSAKRGDEVGATPLFSAVGLDGLDSRTPRVRVTDAGGLSETASSVIWIQNVAPALTISGGASAPLGGEYFLTLVAADPGIDTIASWTINWGDGTSTTVDGTVTSVSKVYDAAGTFTITATATDEDGTYSSNSHSVAVQAPPTANAGGPYNVNEGGLVQLNAGGSTGGGLTYTWDLDGDGLYGESGTAAKRGDENGANPVFSAVGVNGTDSRTPRLRVTNAAGTGNASSVVWIQNVAPTLSVSGTSSVNTGATYTLSLSSSDPGPDTLTSWTIDWGDGTSVTLDGTATSASKVYAAAGAYSLVISATDNEGTYTSPPRTLQVVDPVAPDTAGNTIGTARNFGLLGPGMIKVAEDGVGSADKNDFYRFTVDVPMTVNIKLSNLKDKADLFLLDSAGATLISSKRKGTSEEIIITTLNPGTYYVRALYAGTSSFTTYRLRLETIAPTLDPALAGATDFGGIANGGVKIATGSVAPGDTSEYYKFSLASAAQMYFKLTELTDNADLQILDSTGRVISTAKRMGSSDENLRLTLAAGTYYVKVVLKGSVGTAYRLRVANETV